MITRRLDPDEVSDMFEALTRRMLADPRYSGEKGLDLAGRLDALCAEIVAAADHGPRRTGAPCL